ncbi:Aspartic protease pep1-like protein 1 [Colletotrichum chlorophyti]|uniref:Aspartic protease pep1-like protein 1 n=1 Tax=Colletotrichum chlorophyti TaxID=708187 RepID=A0A1Q8RSA0_9PEZI|nr:Aspartic protease pep1-like protein 1 [Colletotrichum chlorophyti]
MASFLFPLLYSAAVHALPAVPPQLDHSFQPRSFALPVRINPDHLPDGPVALAAAYSKWGIPVPNSLDEHILSRREGTAEDSYWLTDIFIGNPLQKIPVIIDTASPDFWLMSTDTDFAGAAVNGVPVLYDPSKSGTSIEVQDSSWQTKYHDGSSASGKVYLDTLRLGLDFDNNKFWVYNATIQSAAAVSKRFAVDPNSSGILGLAKKSQSHVNPLQPSMVERIKNESHFPFIGIDLRSDSSKGFFDFAYGLRTPEVREPPMPEDEHWSFKIVRSRTNSMPDNSWYSSPNLVATVDTATSLLLLPDDLVSRYYADIPQSAHDPVLKAYVFPCALASGIPDYTFHTKGGYTGTVTKEYINFGPIPGRDDVCYGGIQSSQSETRAILGGVALKSLYVQLNFDDDGDFVSFANKGSMDVCRVTTACET